MPTYVPQGATALRVSIYSPQYSLIILDASADFAGGDITYEDTPSGCGSAQLTVGLLYEQVIQDGYYTARNIVEISSGDDCLQATSLPGATKLYVGSPLGYDTAVGHDAGQIAIYDGSTLTMRIPVTGVGTDGGGFFITVGAPLSGYGNPTVLPGYILGSIIYRRRYAGIIMGRQLQSSRDPTTLVTCTGLGKRLSETTATFAMNTNTVDMGTAIYNLLNDFKTNWPEMNIASGNFSLTGQTSFDSSYVSVQMSSIISDLLSAASSSGDAWMIRVGHDRTPRLLKLYQMSTDTYQYNITLNQGVTYFEARNFQNADQDASQLYNVIEVTGDTNPTTNNPVNAIVTDDQSLLFYGEIDAQPVTNTACKTVDQCARYAQSLLNRNAAPKSNAQVTVATRNDVYNIGPMGLSRGDIILGVHNVTVTEISPAPDVFGLVTSVVTTVTPGADTYQTCRFSAIEPDWNDDVAERANALATALLQNTVTPVSLDQYFVSTGAFNWTISGLVVTTPSFAAIFAVGSVPVSLGGNTFTLAPLTTNWTWITSGNTWVVEQAPANVPGAILYAIFTTTATDVCGSITKAATGIINIPVSALASMGDQAAPVLSNISAVSYPVIGNGSYDAQVSFTVDVQSAPWLVGVALFSLLVNDPSDPHQYPKGVLSSFGIISGEYIGIWKHIGAGNAEDLYVAYQDGQGRFSGAMYVATTVPNPAGSSAFGPVGLTPPNPVNPPTPYKYTNNGGGTYDVDTIVSLDANSTTANNNLAEIEVVVAPHSRSLVPSSNGWAPSGVPVAKRDDGIYDITAGGMGVQVVYDVGLRHVGHTGDRSYVYILPQPTTASQLAQLPFTGAVIDPNTGYLIFSDAIIHPTVLQYVLSAPGIGTMISASWNAQFASGYFGIVMMYSALAGNGYLAQLSPISGSPSVITIQKGVNGIWTTVAQTPATFTNDHVNFHNLEVVAAMTTAGILNLSVIYDGTLALKYSDSAAPYTSGYIGAWFPGASANSPSYIDEKTIAIDMGGSPSSSGIKAQANIVPSSIPGCIVGISSPTNNTTGGSGGNHSWLNAPGGSGAYVGISSGTLLFSDGTQLPFPGATLINLPAGSIGQNGTWYFSVSIVTATLGGIYYLSQTAPTELQLSVFYADGNIPVIYNKTLNVSAGHYQLYGVTTSARRRLL